MPVRWSGAECPRDMTCFLNVRGSSPLDATGAGADTARSTGQLDLFPDLQLSLDLRVYPVKLLREQVAELNAQLR